LGQGSHFIRDWIPFFLIIMAYEGLRGFADDLSLDQIHVTDLIDWERAVSFGFVPTVWLQNVLFIPGSVQWFDVIGTVLYFLHFPLPLVVAFALWLRRRPKYWQFVLSLSLLCGLGFVTYVVFPAAPPWWAAKHGYLPPVYKIIDQTLTIFPGSHSISYLYHNLNPNPVAAMPSLHAAFPWLVFLALWDWQGRRALLFLPYCLMLWWSIVYLGEHYIIDAAAGVLYATLAFALAKVCISLWSHRQDKMEQSRHNTDALLAVEKES
jgi:hypothetical protein